MTERLGRQKRHALGFEELEPRLILDGHGILAHWVDAVNLHTAAPIVRESNLVSSKVSMTGMGILKAGGTEPRPSVESGEDSSIDPEDFVATINNQYFPLVPGTTFVYEGTKDGQDTRTVFAVTHETENILGVITTVVHDQAFVDGTLAEDTTDWFAQDEDGNVWYFGEDTKELDENGAVISTEGSWRAGVDDARPGIVMEAHPHQGDAYQQEFATGVAEDKATVLSRREKVTIDFGSFRKCLETKEFSPLKPGQVENKFYAPGVGLIRSVNVEGGEEESHLVSVTRDRIRDVNPQDFVAKIDNPYFPLVPGTTFVYEGTKDGHASRDVFVVTHDTKNIVGVTTTEVHDQAFIDGQLTEETVEWFVQDKRGNVWYFGEDTKKLDANGVVVSTEGSWQAGVNGARPGIVMEAHPRVGDSYHQEVARGVAEDQAKVLSRRGSVTVPFGSFSKCLETKEFSRLQSGDVDHKFYAAGVGFIRSVKARGEGQEVLELVSVTTV